MRIVPALILLAGALFLMPVAASAAPLALADHAATAKTLAAEGTVVEEAGWRRRARSCGRPVACCTWTCRPYYRPYQYYYWQFYYPYGGPLFY